MLALERQLAEQARLARLGRRHSASEPPATFLAGNGARYLRDGREQRAWMLALLDGAQRRVDFEAYIVRDDATGRAVRDALVRAAERGVAVRVLFDAIGSADPGPAFFEPIVAAGGHVVEVNPVAPWRLRVGRLGRTQAWRPNHRDHRKLLVCDAPRAWLREALAAPEGTGPEAAPAPVAEDDERASVAVTGGRNVGDEYLGLAPGEGQWLDAGLVVAGPAAARLGAHFDAMWEHVEGPAVGHRSLPEAPMGEAWIAAIGTQPGLFNELSWALTRTTRLVRTELRVACAYFVPSARWRRALLDVARRTGRALLVVPETSDVPAVDAASRHLWGRLLERGVSIHRYGHGVLHDKTLVYDGKVAVLGSSNLDPRSQQLNYELSVIVVDDAFVARVVDAHEQAFRASRAYRIADWRARPWLSKARDWAWSLLRSQL
jgi:cardiolipin synthase